VVCAEAGEKRLFRSILGTVDGLLVNQLIDEMKAQRRAADYGEYEPKEKGKRDALLPPPSKASVGVCLRLRV
jgi:hypothetical protein